jgi:hypothetical protein
MRNALLMIGILISASGLVRLGLILAGVWKSPVLRRFERYSAFDDAYYPLPYLLMWAGALVLCAGLLIRQIAGTDFPAHMPGLFLLLLALLAYRSFGIARRYPGTWLAMPRWYAELRERTTREERRRIAFMWLMLPRRARLFYEWNTWAFRTWVDLVIVSTGTQTFDDLMRAVIAARR